MSLLRHRAIVVVLAAFALVSSLMLGRAVAESRAELAAARSYRRGGELLRAVEHYRRALRWSFPMSPYTSEAVSEIEACAAKLEDAGDRSGALLAWRSLLGGAAATRRLHAPPGPAMARARSEVARLAALDTDAQPETGLRAEPRIGESQAMGVTPDPAWSSVLLFGFAVWLASLIVLTRRGFDGTGRFLWRSARAPVWTALAGLLGFVLGLSLA